MPWYGFFGQIDNGIHNRLADFHSGLQKLAVFMLKFVKLQRFFAQGQLVFLIQQFQSFLIFLIKKATKER